MPTRTLTQTGVPKKGAGFFYINQSGWDILSQAVHRADLKNTREWTESGLADGLGEDSGF